MKKSSLLLLFISIITIHFAHAMDSTKRTVRRPIHKKSPHAKPPHITRLKRSINHSENESLSSFKHYFNTIQQMQESHIRAMEELYANQINYAHQSIEQTQQKVYLSEERARAWENYAHSLEQKIRDNQLVQPQKAQADIIADVIRTYYCNNDWGIYADLLSTLHDQLKQPVTMNITPQPPTAAHTPIYVYQNNESNYAAQSHTQIYNNSTDFYASTEQ